MKPRKFRSSLLWQFVRQRPLLVTIAVASRCVWEIIPIALPFIAGALVDNLSKPPGGTDGKPSLWEEWGQRELLLLSIFLLAGFAGTLAVLRSITMAYAGRSLVSYARNQVTQKLLSSSGLGNNEHSGGVWLGLIHRDCAKLRGLLEKAIVRAVTSALRLIAPLLGMLAISWSLTCVLLLGWIVPLLIITRLERRLRQLTKDLSATQDRFTQTSKQLIDGREALFGCKAQGFGIARMRAVIDEVETIQLQIARRSAAVQACLWFTAILTTALAWTIGAQQVTSDGLSLGQLIAFIGLVELAQRPVRSYARVARTLQSTSVAEERLKAALNLPTCDASMPTTQAELWLATGLPNELLFSAEAVSISIGGRLVLNNLSHEFCNQALTVVAGESGCGKSTLLRALAGMLPLQSGRIILQIDGNEVTPSGDILYDVMLVPQRPWIFDGTIRENVTAGLDVVAEDRLIAAADSSGVSHFFADLPMGWESVIGEHGVRLSGGQLLRLALCRAILRRPKVLLLDEPTAGLDAASERLMLDQLKLIARDTMVVMAAHRDACIEAADELLWLDKAKSNSTESSLPSDSSGVGFKLAHESAIDGIAAEAMEVT